MKSMFEIHNQLLFEGTHMAIPVNWGEERDSQEKTYMSGVQQQPGDIQMLERLF